MKVRTARLLLGSTLVATILGMSGLSINYYYIGREQNKEVMLRVYEELEGDPEKEMVFLYNELLRSPEYSQALRSIGYKNFTEIFENIQKLTDKVNKEEGVRFIDTNADTIRKFRSAVKSLDEKL